MSKINIEKFRKRLLAEKNRLETVRARLNEYGGESASDRVGEIVDFDQNHPGDSGTVLFERLKDEALHENVDGLLAQVHDALSKIDEGTYGLCDRCEKPISEGRLEALPYATLCIECQSRLEAL